MPDSCCLLFWEMLLLEVMLCCCMDFVFMLNVQCDISKDSSQSCYSVLYKFIALRRSASPNDTDRNHCDTN